MTNPEVQSFVDLAARTATITTWFDRPIDAVWTLWSDPDRLARWWGPPGVPLTIDHHDLTPGGRVEVTARPAGSVVRGRWSIVGVTPPRSLQFTFSADGLEPTNIDVRLEPTSPTTTTMTLTARFATDIDLDRAIRIGFVRGLERACASARRLP